MSNYDSKKVLNADLGLELMMRDSLSGIEELASMAAARPWCGVLEIISIESSEQDAMQKAWWDVPRVTH